MSVWQIVWAAHEYRPVRGLVYAWLVLWFVSHPARRRAIAAAYRSSRLWGAMEDTEIGRALCATRRRWIRRVERNGLQHRLTVERSTWLERWLGGPPRDYLASASVQYPAEQVGSGQVWQVQTTMLGPFARRREAWRALEQHVTSGVDDEPPSL
jgi:hypothetical protein